MLKKIIFTAVLVLLLADFANAEIRPYDEGMYDLKIDYPALHLSRVDDEGFAQYSDEYVSFKWRNMIFLPRDTPIVGLGPLTPEAMMFMEMRDINGTVFVPSKASFEGMKNYELVEGAKYFEGDARYLGHFRKVDDVNELTIWRPWSVISILGNNMFDPPAKSPITVNSREGSFLNVAIFAPRGMNILDYSSNRSIFKVNEHSVFSYQYNVTSVIYVDSALKLTIQIALGLITIFIVAIVLALYKYIPKINFRSKHFAIAMLFCGLLMFQLAFVVPNPNAVNIQWFLKPEYKGEIPAYYLRYILGMTDSVDVVFIRSFSWNENDPFSTNRNIFLMLRSAERIYIPEELEDELGTVALIKENINGEKIEFIRESEIAALEERWDKSRRYPWGFLFDFSRVAIYSIFLLMSFAATAYLFTLMFEIKGRRDWIIAAIVLLAVPLIMMFGNIITGFIAHLPVTYHGASTLPLTMSALALPFLGQAHSIRAVLIMLGIVFAFTFVANVRKRISIRAFLIPVLVFSLLLTLPQTEFSTKRTITSFACGNCGIQYSGELEWLNFQNFYAALRNNDDLGEFLGKDTAQELETARILRTQGRPQQAIEAFERFIFAHPEDKQIVIALLELGQMYNTNGEFDRGIWAFKTALDKEILPHEKANVLLGLASSYWHKRDRETAIEIYTICINDIDIEDYVVVCMFNRGETYKLIGNRAKAIQDFRTIVEEYPEHRTREAAERWLEGLKEEGK